MPYTYDGDPEQDHGTRHHVWLSVDPEADQTRTWACACSEKDVLTLALAPVAEVAEEGESLEEWLDREEVNEECADWAREVLNLDPRLHEVPGVNFSRAHKLREAGYETRRQLKAATAQDLVEAGLSVGHAENIKSHLGSYPEYREEWEVLDQ